MEPRRRTVVLGGLGVAAGALTGLPPVSAAASTAALTWVGAGPFKHVYDPTPGGPPYEYLNDHCVIQGRDGTWHLYGIIGNSAPPGSFPGGNAEIHFAHATAPALDGPWTTQPYALSVDPNYFSEEHLWAPHVIENAGTYYMFYAAGGSGCAINLATSTDLFNWTRIPQGPVFRGLVARDPFVTRIGNQWVMYYCELANWQSNHIVAARTSTDLIHWSAPRTVFTDPSTDSNASVTESPVVVQRDGTYYLFIGPRFGYVGTDVFRSTDPFNFQLASYAGHVPAHAIEVVGDRVTGAGSFQHGVYLADLQWRSTPPVWHSLDNPAAGLNPQGAIELFALDNNHRIVRRVLPGDWELFSDEVTTVPTVGRNTDGRLELFTVAKDQGLIHRVQRADGTWGDWEVFGGAAGAAPAVSRNADGRLEVFALGPAGAYITHRWQNGGGSASWSDWESFGGAAGAPPVVGVNADGRMEVFALGPGGAYVAHRWQNVPNGGWSSWDTGFGGPAAALSTVNRDGRGLLNVFALAPVSTGVHRRVQTVPSGGWAGWQLADSWADASARTAVNADGRLEMFCIPPGGAQITHRWQTTPTSGAWSNSEVFDSQPVAASPTVIVDASGRQHVFAVAPDGVLRERIQFAPSSGWGPWRTLPGAPILPLPVGHPS
ncbi:family 43 glycosylhydrolase [Kribbella solani]|uniref:PLL-like beta propeller domain-containing protein n=1 Tax=Kribbella solani TaxID=236067 RepID=A0A841DME3_9ACTN|nr:family 43 glycosylhydrolase [Kribbella solani]MBB5976678.1 hypothetical protein [Kribbella solani]